MVDGCDCVIKLVFEKHTSHPCTLAKFNFESPTLDFSNNRLGVIFYSSSTHIGHMPLNRMAYGVKASC